MNKAGFKTLLIDKSDRSIVDDYTGGKLVLYIS
jgi:hypothetical protein